MKSKIISCSVLAILMLETAPIHAAQEAPVNKPESVVDAKAQTTVKKEVFDSMIGYRDTLMFYSFPAEKAVLVVRIDNKNDKFPMAGELYIFSKESSVEDLNKWINNQYSDALHADVPHPRTIMKIPAASFELVSKKVEQGKKETHSGIFNRYNVEFNVKNVPAVGEIKIKDFTETASVFIKTDGAK
jgi:hypothetical protein